MINMKKLLEITGLYKNDGDAGFGYSLRGERLDEVYDLVVQEAEDIANDPVPKIIAELDRFAASKWELDVSEVTLAISYLMAALLARAIPNDEFNFIRRLVFRP